MAETGLVRNGRGLYVNGLSGTGIQPEAGSRHIGLEDITMAFVKAALAHM